MEGVIVREEEERTERQTNQIGLGSAGGGGAAQKEEEGREANSLAIDSHNSWQPAAATTGSN